MIEFMGHCSTVNHDGEGVEVELECDVEWGLDEIVEELLYVIEVMFRVTDMRQVVVILGFNPHRVFVEECRHEY